MTHEEYSHSVSDLLAGPCEEWHRLPDGACMWCGYGMAAPNSTRLVEPFIQRLLDDMADEIAIGRTPTTRHPK